MPTLVAAVSSISVALSGRKMVHVFTPRLCGNLVPLPDTSGVGYLSGSAPDGLVTVEGVPSSAEIRLLWRPASGTFSDGVLVAKTVAAVDGTWTFTGLNTSMRFDVVARKAGFNDVIVSNVQPTV